MRVLARVSLVVAFAACSQPLPPPASGPGAVLIPAGSVWRHAVDIPLEDDWLVAEYDDRNWAEGPGPLGTSISGLRTETADPTALEPPQMAVLFRKSFELPEGHGIEGLTVHYLRDDGLRLWLNGTEMLRHDLRAGEITRASLAARAVHRPEEQDWERLALPADGLRPGINQIAVAVHQASVSGGDLIFDLELRGFRQSDAPVLTRGPYLQQTSQKRSVIRWQTAGPARGWVDLGEAPGEVTRRFDERIARRNHEVEVTGLPEGRVHYSVGVGESVLAGGDAAHRIPRPGKTVRLWITGDQGSGDEHAREVRDGMLSAAGPRSPGAWITLGDNAYPSGTEAELQVAVFDTFAGLLANTTLWPAPGNHDLIGTTPDRDESPYFDVFSLPTQGEAGGVPSHRERWYAFDWGPVHVVSLDSVSGHRTRNGPMLQWLEADLDRARAPWTIAVLHHPPHSRGSHDSDKEVATSLVRERILPILERHGVAVVFAGHSHNYERSSEDETPVFVVSGNASIRGSGPLDHPLMKVSRGGQLGSLLVDADACSFDVRAIDQDGEVYDRFRLENAATCAP
ncbi:MAG: hypothetical protein GY937_03130 [bacterium]|nr:hypothetical protein [bacterium]